MTSATKHNSSSSNRTLPKVKRVASIPDPSYAKNYIHRQVGEYIDEFILFDYAMKARKNVLIEGPTGGGKTSAIVAWAAARKLHFYSVSSSNGVEPSQLFGRMIPDESDKGGRGLRWQDGPVTDIVRNGGVLLINEINFIPERISTVLFSLLDKRQEIQLVDHKGEVIRAHRNFMVFADMNPDYEGTRALNKALRNRFSVQLVWEYDPKVEESLVSSAALRTMADQLRKAHQAGEYETPISTNMLIEFEEHFKYLGFDFASVNFVNHFTADERQPVKIVLDTHKTNLETDLSKIKRLTPYGDDVYDKDMGGYYGKDWSYEEEEED